jgi:type II secretory pathway predicted ATPase ExeA
MSLYLEHFGLREAPFRITPHTDFFFSGANRGPTLEALIYAITRDEGIVKVTGEVGSGKTMLCRMLLERLPDEVESLYLANPSLSRTEILGAIADELGIPVDGKTTHSLVRALQDALVERFAAGKRVVIMIDEAHAMPSESLEEIRLLSNLESKAEKLLQIALFAQPELDERLAANDMRQLRERITQHFNLVPLKGNEVGNYIDFRLRAAGYHGPNPFSPRALELIAGISEGLSRRINILADKALLAAYSEGAHDVDVAQVRTAANDARFTRLLTRPTWNWPWRGAAAAAAAALALGIAVLFLNRPAPSPPVAPEAAAAATPAPAPANAAGALPAKSDRADKGK